MANAAQMERSWSRFATTQLGLPQILLVAAFIRVVEMVFLFEGPVHDGTTRVVTALNWMRDGTPFVGRTFWPEGNYILPIFALSIWSDPYWSPRILFALVALTNIWAIYRLTEAVADRQSAAIAAWVVALMPYHIMVSANAAMSEPALVTCALMAVLAMVRYFEAPSTAWAAAAGVWIALGTLFRFDGVVMGIPAALVIASCLPRIGWQRFLRDSAVLAVTGLAFVVFIFWTWSSIHGDASYFLKLSKYNTAQFFVDGKHPRWPHWIYQIYSILFWPGSLLILLTPLVAIFGFAGLWQSVRRREPKMWIPALALLCLTAWFTWGVLDQRILAQFRYSLALTCLLAVFVPGGIYAAGRLMPSLGASGMIKAALAVGLVFQAAITYFALTNNGTLGRQLRSISPIIPGQFASRDLLRWIDQTSPAAAIMITPHVTSQSLFTLRSQALARQGRITLQPYYLPDGAAIHTRKSLESEIVEKLARMRFIVTDTSGGELGLQDGLNTELVIPECKPGAQACRWRGFTFRRHAVFRNARIWEISRS